jgi:hypothetical protein
MIIMRLSIDLSERSREGEYDNERMRVSSFLLSILNSTFTTLAPNFSKAYPQFLTQLGGPKSHSHADARS